MTHGQSKHKQSQHACQRRESSDVRARSKKERYMVRAGVESTTTCTGGTHAIIHRCRWARQTNLRKHDCLNATRARASAWWTQWQMQERATRAGRGRDASALIPALAPVHYNGVAIADSSDTSPSQNHNHPPRRTRSHADPAPTSHTLIPHTPSAWL